MKVDTLTPVLRAAPGERATCRLRIENDEAGPLAYGLRVVGFDENDVVRPAPNGPLPPGSVEEVELEFRVPDAFAAGHHSVAVEVMPARPGTPPVIAGITVAVGQIDDVAMAVVPSTIRGHRRGKFRLDLDNRSREALDVELAGEGPDLQITLRPDRVQLRPGDRVRTSGKVKGPRHLIGEPRQHSFTVTARSRSAPSYAPATFHQRPLIPRSLRTLVAVLLIVGLWAGALGAGVYWWMEGREGGGTANLAELVDTDGDGIPDTPATQLIDTDGDGVPDTPAAEVAAEIAAGGAEPPQEGGSGLPTHTVITGTVKAGETGEDDGISVTLSPIDLDAPASAGPTGGPAGESRGPAGESRGPAGESRGPAGESRRPVGLPARMPDQVSEPSQPGVSAIRQTVSVESTATGPDGAFLFADVPVRQTYEVHFAHEGFDSQSFVVTPPDDGSPVELEVVLEPASGALSGTVSGPAGPLGNVELMLTGGDLTFATTTASAGAVGTWSIPGISTPGTYTLTATLRGYGTEVLQITLEPGEQRSGVDISMVPDVGSIIGRVTTGGTPLGGVTLTASSGDDTRTTTSLTEGDTGLYAFPRLPIPGRYTVTASREGYVPQTRLVTLDGNVTGVDFDLVRTTATIRGVVTSVGPNGADRGPLPGAQITVSQDDLSFDTDSASPPDANPGSFVITDLPPGTYLVEFSRFDHRPASRIVTVAAGEVADLGRVPLRFRPRRGVDQLGSLEVRVVDNGGDPLTGATVAVRDVNTGRVVARMSDEGRDRQATFLFDPIDVGTYDVTARKPQFKPRTARVSIGPSQRETLQLILFEQGQATGRIVDSLSDPDDPTPLSGYFIDIYNVLDNGERGSVRLQGISPLPPDDDGNIVWETPPRSLPIGTYEVVVDQPPPGYRVRPDQVLAAGLPPMRFEVLPEGQAVIELRDIEADPLPNLTGQVLTPQLSAQNEVTFAPINSSSLSVLLRCPDGDRDFEGVNGSLGAGFFSFPKETVDQALGSADGATCTLTAEADGFVTTSVPVRLEPSDGERDPDLSLNIALFQPSDVGGRTYWVDAGDGNRQIAAGGIVVTSAGRVITGFRPGPGTQDPRLTLSPGPVSTTATADGMWAFGTPRQVFGRMTYTFADPAGNYEPRQVAITIDENGRSAAPIPPDDPLELDDAGSIDVELDAHGGVVQGDFVLRSVTPDETGFQMDLSGAADIEVDATGTGPFRQAVTTTEDPGTYRAEFQIPDNYRPFAAGGSPPPQSVGFFQNPGQDVFFTREYVELGRIEVTVEDAFGGPVEGATVALAHVPSPFLGDPSVSPIPEQETGADGIATFEDLPVNTFDPVGLPVTYRARVTAADGHDLTNAEIVTSVVAGQTASVEITIPRFGSIVGRVLGEIPNQDPAGLVPLRVGEGLVVQAQRVDASGLPLEAPILGVPDPSDGDRFSVSGPPGLYTITVSHPAYEDEPIQIPNGLDLPNGTRAYVMANLAPGNVNPNVLDPPWVLRARPGTLDLTVLRNTLSGDGVVGARVTLDGPVTPTNLFTDDDGRLVVNDLPQGTYRLEIRELDGNSFDASFPVIISVSIPFGDTAEARTRVVRAPLPQIGGAIVGDIVVRNSEQDVLPVPQVTVTRTYQPPAVEIGGPGTTVPNTATEGNLNPEPGTEPQPSVTVGPGQSSLRFRFGHLATGVHELTFADIIGYDPPGPVTVNVPVATGETTVDADDTVYTALDRTVIVNVTTPDGEFDGVVVQLEDPDPGTNPVTVTGVNGRYTFTGVAPEVDEYTITVMRELHTTEEVAVAVPPGDPDEPIDVDVVLEGEFARIVGTAHKRLSSAPTTTPVGAEGTALLINETTGQTVAAGPITSVNGVPGTYVFDLTENLGDEYSVRVEALGFAPRQVPVPDLNLGQTTTMDLIVIPALARVDITVNGPPPGNITVEVTGPDEHIGVTPTRTGRTFTFLLDPGTNPGNGLTYSFRATAPGFLPVDITDVAITTPGDTVPITVEMEPSSVSGTVLSAATGEPVVDAAVALLGPGGATVATTTTDGGGNYEFEGVGVGTWTVVAERLTVGRGSATATTSASASATADISLTPRPITVTYTVNADDAIVELVDDTGAVIDNQPPLVADESLLPTLSWRASAPGFVGESGSIPLPTNTFDTAEFTEHVEVVLQEE